MAFFSAMILGITSKTTNRSVGRRVGIPTTKVRILFSIIVMTSIGCGDPAADWAPGGLYSVSNGDETFGVVKILAVDPEAVSIRIYSDEFDSRPAITSSEELTFGTIEHEYPGIGHMALSPGDFAFWFPVKMGEEEVPDEELDGYREWVDAGGGVMDFSAFDDLPEAEQGVEDAGLETVADDPNGSEEASADGE